MMWIRVLVTAGLAVALSLATFAGQLPLAVATAVVVLVIAYSWPRLTDSPQPRTTSIMLAVIGLGGLASVMFSESSEPLVWLAPIAGGALLWTFVQHLSRGVEASHAVANVSAQMTGSVIVLCLGPLLAAMIIPNDHVIFLICLFSLTAALAAIALPWPAIYTTPLAMVLAVLVALATASLLESLLAGWLVSSVLGLVMASLVIAVDRLLGQVARGLYQARVARAPEPDLVAALVTAPGQGARRDAMQNATERVLDKTRRFSVQLALGAVPVALSGVVIYIAERAVFF